MTACSGVVHYVTEGVAPECRLMFYHALTAIRFKVGQNLSWNKTINKVEIINAQSKGRYTLATDANCADAAWSNLNTPATFTLDGINISTSQVANTILTGKEGDNYTFYMLPQSLAGVSVRISFTDGTSVDANLKGEWKPGTTVTYSMSNKNSSWEYHLDVTDPAVVGYTGTMAKNYKIKSYRVDPATGTQQPVAWKVVGYAPVDDDHFSMDKKPDWLQSMDMMNGEGNTVDISGNATLKSDVVDFAAQRNASMQNATSLGTSTEPYNLSNSTGAAAVENTANSYVVSAPGYYRIPLVYGNAIKGGTANTSAYKASINKSYCLLNFKDHADIDIDDPWITKTNSGAYVPTGAKLVWADEKGLVTNLKVTGTGTDAFVNFEVPQANIMNGNAVISVVMGTDVLWSWHLWFAPKEVLETIACTNNKNKVYRFTKETLGWKFTKWNGTTYDQPRKIRVKVEQIVGNNGVKQFGIFTITQNNGNEREGYAPFYQWGRKDAMLLYGTPAEGPKYSIENSSVSFGFTIKNPTTLPIYKSYLNLWSIDNDVRGLNDNMVEKTVYDPCPVGYHIPASNAFSGFTKQTAVGSFSKGWIFNNQQENPTAQIFFPACGYYHHDYDALWEVGELGKYITVSINSGSGASSFTFDKNNDEIGSFGFLFYCGFSVRPVAE